MRIISKVRDYYDSGAAYGVDTNTVFERKPYFVREDHALFEVFERYMGYNTSYRFWYNGNPGSTRHLEKLVYLDYEYANFKIIVADKIYTGIKVTKISTGGYPGPHGPKYFWTAEDTNAFLKEIIPEEYFDSTSTFGRGNKNPFAIRELDKHLQNIMLNNHIVIISKDIKGENYGKGLLINGDCLSLSGIQRAVDPTTMFSNIDQWISMMNDSSRKMVEISDKDKLVKHGMDETSFRGPSSKRKIKG